MNRRKNAAVPPGMILMADGTVATDDQTGAPFKYTLARQARYDEIICFEDMKVYIKVPVEECWGNTGNAQIATRWININKGDENEPNYRSSRRMKDRNPSLQHHQVNVCAC